MDFLLSVCVVSKMFLIYEIKQIRFAVLNKPFKHTNNQHGLSVGQLTGI